MIKGLIKIKKEKEYFKFKVFHPSKDLIIHRGSGLTKKSAEDEANIFLNSYKKKWNL